MAQRTPRLGPATRDPWSPHDDLCSPADVTRDRSGTGLCTPTELGSERSIPQSRPHSSAASTTNLTAPGSAGKDH